MNGIVTEGAPSSLPLTFTFSRPSPLLVPRKTTDTHTTDTEPFPSPPKLTSSVSPALYVWERERR